MLLVAGLVAYNLHTNTSKLTCKFGVRFHCTPSCANASLNSAFAVNIVSARVLSFPANALTVSQPVKACSPGNALQTSGPMDAGTLIYQSNECEFECHTIETVEPVCCL